MDPLTLAVSRMRRRRFEEAVDACTGMLEGRADEAAWTVKCLSLTALDFVDELEVEDEEDELMEDAAMAKAPRPGTSMRAPPPAAAAQTPAAVLSRAMRPSSSSASGAGGRPLSGFARPGTQQRRRPGTSAARPTTTTTAVAAGGRRVRVGTQSMLAASDRFLQVSALDFGRWARRGGAAKALCDYLLQCEHNPRAAMQLCAEATAACEYRDWWWKARLGRCYHRLGMYRDAEKQFRSALRQQPMLLTSLELAKVYQRLDLPLTAVEVYRRAGEALEGDDASLLVAAARVHDAMGDLDAAVAHYRRVLAVDASSVEAVAQLASHHFYSDQPEVALRLYRRLMQMGVQNCEVYNNVALASWYAGQYDLCVKAMRRAMDLATDETAGDVHFNVSHIAVGVGDLKLAYQALKIAVSADPGHAEAFNNLGVLEVLKQNAGQARACLETAQSLAPGAHEPAYNSALLAFKLGDCQTSSREAAKARASFPGHSDTAELQDRLRRHLSLM